MIDKLLQRIANRHQPHFDEQTLATLTSQMHEEKMDSKSSLSGHSIAPASDAFAAPFSAVFASSYPATRHTRQFTESGQTHNQDAWLQASQAYMEQRAKGLGKPEQPVFFANWTDAHVAVAQLLWRDRERLHQGFIEIRSTDALVAVVYPQQSLVLLRPAMCDDAAHVASLTLAQLPEKYNAPPIEAYKGFMHAQLHTLLWFMGQAYTGAPQLLPDNIDRCELQLRRFPYIEPAAMDLRHLSLMHLFSSGSLSFTRLQTLLDPEHLSPLCADICSLYFTGALQLITRQR